MYNYFFFFLEHIKSVISKHKQLKQSCEDRDGKHFTFNNSFILFLLNFLHLPFTFFFFLSYYFGVLIKICISPSCDMILWFHYRFINILDVCIRLILRSVYVPLFKQTFMSCQMIDRMREVVSRIADVPSCIEELFELQAWIGDVPYELEKIRVRVLSSTKKERK